MFGKYYKLTKNFSIFLIIGILTSVAQALLLWLLVDNLKYPVFITTLIVALVVYLAKYYAYVSIGIMENKFIQYNIINLAILLLNVVVIWLMVNFLGFFASVSSVILAVTFFIIRFAMLSNAKLINNR